MVTCQIDPNTSEGNVNAESNTADTKDTATLKAPLPTNVKTQKLTLRTLTPTMQTLTPTLRAPISLLNMKKTCAMQLFHFYMFSPVLFNKASSSSSSDSSYVVLSNTPSCGRPVDKSVPPVMVVVYISV